MKNRVRDPSDAVFLCIVFNVSLMYFGSGKNFTILYDLCNFPPLGSSVSLFNTLLLKSGFFLAFNDFLCNFVKVKMW